MTRNRGHRLKPPAEERPFEAEMDRYHREKEREDAAWSRKCVRDSLPASLPAY